MAAFQDLNTLFSNLERPFLILNNDNIEYMNSAAKQALHIQNQNFQQQDFFKFCLSMQIDLTPSSQELKSGHYFVSNINGTATRWDIQALSNKPNQNHFLLLGSETTFTSDSLIDLFDIIYNIPSSIYWKDTQGRYLGCNASTLEIIDFATEKELIGKTDHDIAKIKDWPSSLVEQIKATDDQVIQSKKPIFNIEEGPFKTKNNSNLYQLTTKIPLFDKETKVIGILGTSIDITEIKQSHVASNKIDLEFLDKLNKRIMGPAAKTYDSVQEYVENLYLYLDNIIYNMPGSVYWKDVNGVYLGCNAGALEIVNVSSRDQIIGKTNHDFARWQHWPEGLADSIDEAERKIITTKKPLENIEDGPFKTKNNPAVYQLTNKVPLFDREKNVIGILGISIDITERKRAQDNEKLALQKSAADQAMKRAMLVFSGMSTHDLRTPLSSINLCASFLNKHLTTLIEAYKTAAQNNLAITPIRDKTLTDIQQIPNDIMQSVHEANNYIDSSLKSLKGASNGEELMDEAQLAECNAERLLRRVIDTYPYKEGQASLLHYNADCDFSFQGNVIFFNRLIENLIKNAFEQIQIKGHGEIFISCGQEENFNIIKIKDTAGGVTQEIIDTLFSGIQSSKNGGTGIGLSSAKQIMYSMRGDVSCRLVEGDCIEFVLSFPLSDVKNLGSFIA